MFEVTKESVWNDLQKVREQSPVIHNITNFVVMNNTANALLAIGASPVMAHAEEEVADMTKIANALVINIGTLSERWVVAMGAAMRQAAKQKKPIVLDPVGAGATPYRTQTVEALIHSVKPQVITGNASEIRAVAEGHANTKGVDSADPVEAAVESAVKLSKHLNCVVCVSGEDDIVVYGDQVLCLCNGHPMMGKVTGMGCTATVIIAAFAAVNPIIPQATAHAMSVLAIAGEMAAEKAKGPGSLQLEILDALYNLSENDIADRLKVDKNKYERIVAGN